MKMKMQQVAQAAAGGTMSGQSEQLLVMTYNVLAQCYVRSSFFPYCTPAALRWKNRSKKLAEVFGSLPVRPDVICLQEVDQYDEFWAGTMEQIGYSGIYLKKSIGKKDGVAMFWQPEKVELIGHQTIELDEPVGDEADCNEDLLERTKRGSVGVISHFKKFAGVETAFEFVLATTHLFWDPKQEDVKLLQTQRMLRRLKQFTSSLDVPVIFAGDFNSLPDSKVYNFITAGPEHNYNSAYSQYVDPVSTSSGPNEPSFTNVNGASDGPDGKQVPSFIGTLDYIFYQAPRAMRPVALMEIMSRDEATKDIALPSSFSPSDHLPLLCGFQIQLP